MATAVTEEDRIGVETGFQARDDGFDLLFAGRIVLSHRPVSPAVVMARGASSVLMYRGNFRIEDAPSEETAPRDVVLSGNGVTLSDEAGEAVRLTASTWSSTLRLAKLCGAVASR